MSRLIMIKGLNQNLIEMTNLKLIYLFIILALLSHSAAAQESSDSLSYRVQTKDGNVYIGTIEEEDAGKIVLQTLNVGKLTIPKSEISQIAPVDPAQIKTGAYWFENPQATRYFWQPNGYGLKKGEGYYQNVWIMFNQVSIGVTDNVSVGLGMVPLFLFAGAPTPVWITPKFSIPITKDKLNIGGGAVLGTIIGEEDSGFGVLYGLGTFGSRDKNVSVGLGWGFAGGEIANSPTITVSALIRTGPRGYFLTENYIINSGLEQLGLISLGGRRIIGKAGLDFGAFIPVGADTFFAFPWLGITIPFGKKAPAQIIKP